ncbi:uncharacterized protein A1O9_08112 [Exophiala aquamarina CBS 119918]|uniref:FAS1 domain-containing protein n=1 Tax=Exophiala aquamarina CBS 119918 TaxID=1182545 RepID=A0A072P6M6_9EURO|nr:uncharacterized protein A1O9_08112 [Exophiala aquamarina CBS 119918]KEF55362.1 hypothetical protein A1O9_08112 [Exophiala aquamarina CBS 119918]
MTKFVLSFAVFLAAATTQNLSSVLQSTQALSSLYSNLTAFPEFLSQLNELQNITFLAPNNDAIARLVQSPFGRTLQADQALLLAHYSYHVLNGSFYTFETAELVSTLLEFGPYSQVSTGQAVEVVPGPDPLSPSDVTFFSGLNSTARLIGHAFNFSGGVVHIIDNFLIIPQNLSVTAVQANLTSAVGAVMAAGRIWLGLFDGLQDATVFLPTNEAYREIGSILENISEFNMSSICNYQAVDDLLYLDDLKNGSYQSFQFANISVVVRGDDVFIGNAKIVVPNLLVRGGIAHVIDRVLNPYNITVNPHIVDSSAAFAGALPVSYLPFVEDVATSTIDLPDPAASQSSATTTSSTEDSQNRQTSLGLSTSAKAGIGVGIGLGFVFVVSLIFFYVRTRRKARKDANTSTTEISPAEKDLAAELPGSGRSPHDLRAELDGISRAELEATVPGVSIVAK